MKLNKKSILIVLLAIIIIAVMIGGTVAWLTASSKLVNSFTVGTFEKPKTNPVTQETITLDSYLYEPNWDASQAKLIPGVSIDKDPYVGIGAGSEDAVVYVYVQNDFAGTETAKNKVYFTLNTGWEAVAGQTVAGAEADTYASGLFKYTSGLTGSADKDAWTTTALFSDIEVAEDATSENLTPAGATKDITVSCFIHQAKNAQGTAIDDATIILPAAKVAFGIN